MKWTTRSVRNAAFLLMLAAAPLARQQTVGAVTCMDFCNDCYVAYQECSACFGSGCSMVGQNCSNWVCFWCNGGPWDCS
jgi:hypothetical protein